MLERGSETPNINKQLIHVYYTYTQTCISVQALPQAAYPASGMKRSMAQCVCYIR